MVEGKIKKIIDEKFEKDCRKKFDEFGIPIQKKKRDVELLHIHILNQYFGRTKQRIKEFEEIITFEKLKKLMYDKFFYEDLKFLKYLIKHLTGDCKLRKEEKIKELAIQYSAEYFVDLILKERGDKKWKI